MNTYTPEKIVMSRPCHQNRRREEGSQGKHRKSILVKKEWWQIWGTMLSSRAMSRTGKRWRDIEINGMRLLRSSGKMPWNHRKILNVIVMFPYEKLDELQTDLAAKYMNL